MKTCEFFRLAAAPAVPDWDAAEMRKRVQARKPRRNAVWYGAAAAVLALILAAGAFFLPRPAAPSAPTLSAPPEPAPLPPETPPVQTPAAVPDAPPEEVEPEEPPLPPDELHILEADDFFEVDAALSVERMRLMEKHREWWDLDQILDYWGWDPLPAELPEGLKADFDGDSYWIYAEAAAEGFLYDQFSFEWSEKPSGSGYDPLERSVVLTAGTQPIFQCGVFAFENEMQLSTVAGVPMYLAHRDMPYGPYTVVENGPNIPAGYYPAFQAQFRLNGLYLEVMTENLTQEEFVAVLHAVVKA